MAQWIEISLTVDGEGASVEFVRVEYDLGRALAGIRASDLPDDFAEYLRTGAYVADQIAFTLERI